ncbi:FAD-dependent oxidoreductase [Embleya sp. NPDC008237]|uniref:FAD-dependent oxidoreductase n=1 Tax=Embleya sp. NPDC008237 TaxID=3363978 RepID=UPI0036E05A2C
MKPCRRRRLHRPTGHEHAVVIGAGIAGLLTARVLTESFTRVTIIERDRLGPLPLPRKGVPQGRHAHALQARGLQAFEELLPGIRQELAAAGAPPVDFCRDGRLYLPSGSPPPQDSGIHIQPVSRPLLEAIVREHVLRTPDIRLRDACTVVGLTTIDGGRTVTGVRLRPRSIRRDIDTEVTNQEADLVVDASGRGSHLPDWLTALGLPHVAESVVDAEVGYATRVYHTTTPSGWRAIFELPQPPADRRGVFALRVENDLLIVTLQGAAGDHPPTDDGGFDAFIKSLSCDLHETVRHSRPQSTAVRYARTANLRRRYDRLPRWPDGLMVLGDAACTLNPVYAQGMTVAALEALALRELLTRRHRRPSAGIAGEFQRRVARVTVWPWVIATLPDRAWQDERPPLPFRLGLWYLDRWQRHVPTDPRMFHDIARITNMTGSPLLLFHPRHVTHMAITTLRRTRRAPGP